MFSDVHHFKDWLTQAEQPFLIRSMEPLNPNTAYTILEELKAVFTKSAEATRGDYSWLNLSGILGEAILPIMKATQKVETLSTGSEKKKFAVAATRALFRLIDRGIEHDQNHVGSAMPITGPGNENIEEMFVIPLAEQAIEQCYEIGKGTFFQ